MLLVRAAHLAGVAEKTFYFKTKADALTARRLFENEIGAQASTAVAEAVERYLLEEMTQRRGLKPSTIAEARARLNPLIRLAPATMREITVEHVEERLSQLDAVASRRGTLVRMRDFFRFAVAEGMIDADPSEGVEVKGRAGRGRPTLTRAEARVLDAHLWPIAEGYGPQSEIACAILVLLYLGLRRAEVLRLQVRDLDLEATPPLLSVERWAKSERGYRDVEVPARLADLLRRRTAKRTLDAWLWPSDAAAGHRGPTWLLKGVRRACVEAGVSVVTPQGLRGTHGKLARTAGQTAHAVQAQLGHEDARTTVDSYIGEDVEHREQTRRAGRSLMKP